MGLNQSNPGCYNAPLSNQKKKVPKLNQDEISRFEKETLFTAHEVIMLHKAYRRHACNDGSVEREEFVDMFSNYNKSAKALLFLDHIFRTWDFEANGNLSKCIVYRAFFRIFF